MPKKNKDVNNKFVHDNNKLETWNDLIDLAKRNVLWAKIKKEELEAAIAVYEQKRDAGMPFPSGGLGV